MQHSRIYNYLSTIKPGNLIRYLILKVIAYAVFWRFVNHISPVDDSPVSSSISTSNWFDSVSLQIKDSGYLYNDESRQILVKKRRSIRYGSKSKINKTLLKLQCPQTHSWFRLRGSSLSDCNWTRTNNHLDHKRTPNYLAKLTND